MSTTEKNLLSNISVDQMKKVKVFGELPERVGLPRNENIALFAGELKENIEETVVYQDAEKGQEITLQQLYSMFTADNTTGELVDATFDDEDIKLIPFGKGGRAKQQIVAKGKMPVAFRIVENEDAVKIAAGATKAYLESPTNGPARVAAYAAKGIATDTENFPLLVTRSAKKSSTDPDNWKLAQRSMIELVFEEEN